MLTFIWKDTAFKMNYQLHITRIYFLNIFAIFNLKDGVLRGIYYDRFVFKTKKRILSPFEIYIGEVALWCSLAISNVSNWHFTPIFTSHKIIWQFAKYRSCLRLRSESQEINEWYMFLLFLLLLPPPPSLLLLLFRQSRGR